MSSISWAKHQNFLFLDDFFSQVLNKAFSLSASSSAFSSF